MKEALIQIRADSEAALDEAFDRAASATRSGKPSDPVAVFTLSSPAQLFSVITPKRWELIEHLQKIGPSSIRGLARSLERDIKRVHDDVSALSDWGIIEQTDDRKIHIPYEVIHANFDLRPAADHHWGGTPFGPSPRAPLPARRFGCFRRQDDASAFPASLVRFQPEYDRQDQDIPREALSSVEPRAGRGIEWQLLKKPRCPFFGILPVPACWHWR